MAANNRAVLVALLLILPAPRIRAADPEKTELFVAGEGGYAAYRIPGIVATGNTVLAFCEARRDGAADWGEIDVLMRRSTDGGRTWDPPRKIVEPPADAKQNPVRPKRKGGGITVNNPVTIADPSGDVVHFLYCVEYGRCFYRRSEDAGGTFARPVDITPTFERFRPQYDWKVIATGPGHGVRLRSGRLLVPVWLSTSTQGPHRPSRVATIYSDDGGRTWERGDLVPTPGLVNPSETAAAELADGTVMLNIRHETEPHVRAVITGPNGATGWSAPRLDGALPEPVCMGSLVRTGDVLLFSNPHNPGGRERKNLTVKLSRDGGKTWPASLTLEPGPSAYSDLAVSADGTVFCFYERGPRLTVAKFDLASLTPPAP